MSMNHYGPRPKGVWKHIMSVYGVPTLQQLQLTNQVTHITL